MFPVHLRLPRRISSITQTIPQPSSPALGGRHARLLLQKAFDLCGIHQESPEPQRIAKASLIDEARRCEPAAGAPSAPRVYCFGGASFSPVSSASTLCRAISSRMNLSNVSGVLSAAGGGAMPSSAIGFLNLSVCSTSLRCLLR